jgi:hypothetical protein
MSTWRVNEGLEPLLVQLHAGHPGIVIGTIGNLKHQEEESDHNPNAAGRVNAADLMLGPHFSEAQAKALIPFLIADRRTKYLIHDRKIWRSTQGHSAALAGWHDYDEEDPHTDHVHISVWDGAHTDTRPWTLEEDVSPEQLLAYDGVTNLYHDAKTNPTVTVGSALKAAVSADVKLNEVEAKLDALGKAVAALAAKLG